MMTNTVKKKKKCFVISPIGEDGSSTRKRADKILKYVLKPVVESLGYEAPMRADHLSSPGVITTQIIQRINDDDLVIADLTEQNPNVFYELAIRHMIEKPLVQLIEKGHKLPFDVAASRTIHIDHTDLDSVEEVKTELKKQIQAAEKHPEKVDNPISVSMELQALKQSDDPTHQILGEIQERLEAMESTVNSIESDVSTVESAISNIDGWSSLDDINNKVSEVVEKIENLPTAE